MIDEIEAWPHIRYLLRRSKAQTADEHVVRESYDTSTGPLNLICFVVRVATPASDGLAGRRIELFFPQDDQSRRQLEQL